MATKIRLQRGGRKSYAFYRIVIADARAPRDGRFTEKIGTYNPNTNPATVDLDFDRALYWVETGAQPTATAHNILKAVYANGTLVKQYDVVIYGDINGDGKISVVDLVMMQKQILGTSQLSGAYAAAADISRDGKVSVKDLVLLQKHIINAAQIEQ